MTTFKLTNQVKLNHGIEQLFYRSDDMLIIFHSHPTKAFNWVCDYASKNVTPKIWRKLINKYIEQGIAQHDYKGGFNEAISILSIN